MRNETWWYNIYPNRLVGKLLLSLSLALLLCVHLAPHIGAAPEAPGDAAAPAATTWFVDGATGDDGLSCETSTTACATVGAAVGKASAGDTIQIAAGVYTENLSLQNLTLIGAGPDATILDGGQVDRVLDSFDQVTLVDLTVRNGRVTTSGDVFQTSGAGIRNMGILTLDNTTVINNTTLGHGAGIFNNGSVIARDSEIRGNTADGVGGGIFNWRTAVALTVTNSLIAENHAGEGGGVLSAAPLFLADTTLRGNTADSYGAGISVGENTAELVNVTVQSNLAYLLGAGLFNQGGVVTVTNSTISDNTAQYFSGVYNTLAQSSMTILNSTIVHNHRSSSAGTLAGGVANTTGATLSIQNTIVAHNGGDQCRAHDNWTSGGHNLASDGSCEFTQAGDIQGMDPHLAPLDDFGGPTWTHALLPGSPAIDAGDNTSCAATDQRGVSRPIDGDGDGLANCDIGAFEARNQLSINDVTVTEGDAGSVGAVFTVTVSPTSTQSITVAYSTAAGTASAGSDYDAASGQLLFSPGESAKQIIVNVTGDADDEPDETFTVDLGLAMGADVVDDQGIGTIVDDDAAPSLVIGNRTVVEGNAGSVNAIFSVTLSPASSRVVTVAYATADDLAAAGSDYDAQAGTLAFQPGDTTRTITVTVNGDLVDEGQSETFRVVLSDPTNAMIVTAHGLGTILDDDNALLDIPGGPHVLEGDLGGLPAVFTVTLSIPAAFTVTVDYHTEDGFGDTGAVGGQDYVSANGTLTFAPGETTRFITVTIQGDLIDEPDESFTVRLTNPDPVSTGANTSYAYILDDDDMPSLIIADQLVTEGDSGPVSALVTVTLVITSGHSVTAHYATADGTATAGSDYQVAAGTLIFSPGETTKVISVTVLGDDIDEGESEAFAVNLTDPTHAKIPDSQALGTILDDDTALITIGAGPQVLEGDTGQSAALFDVELTTPAAFTVTVDYYTSDGVGIGGAIAPQDYASASGTLTFAPGVTSQSIAVTVNGDTAVEPDEVFYVQLANPNPVLLQLGSSSGWILNDDVEGTYAFSVFLPAVQRGQ